MKRRVDDLAIFGGPAAFLQPLFVGRPNKINRDRLFERLNRVLDNEWPASDGPLTSEFERRVADMVGARNCVATANATLGLNLLAHAAGLTGEVVIPSLTFVATPHSMQWVGVEPVFCDIDPETGSMDVASAEAAITDRTSAIIGVHLWGVPCRVDELQELATRKGLYLFYDSAHALGCTAGGRAIGNFGDAEVFSFHSTKLVNSFEGGAIVTNDDELAQRVRALQNFGIGLRGVNQAGGTDAKMCEVSAAQGLTSLDGFAEVVRRNRANYDLYQSELGGLPGVRLIRFSEKERNNYQYVIAEINAEVTGISRDLMMELLRAEQINTKAYFSPGCHEYEPYRSRRPVDLPHTQRMASRIVALPNGTNVGEEEIRRICNIIRLALSNGSEVTARWKRQRQAGAGRA